MATQQVAVQEVESSWDKVAAREVSKLMAYLPPWILAPLVYGMGWAFSVVLESDDPQVIAWTMFLMALAVLGLTGTAWVQSHARSAKGKVHTTATTFFVGMWVCAATINGPAGIFTGRVALIGGVALAASFNIRTLIRRKELDGVNLADPLKLLFGHGADKAGMPAVEARTTKASRHKVEGSVQLEQGKQTAEDLGKKVAYIESGIPLPPGSIITSLDPDDASKANVVISDPRVMKKPILWVGPSRPGASIADPIRIGLWQDLDEIEYSIVGHHLQMMGMTGAGKSIGGAWNYLAEAVTRYDVAVFAGDVTKGEQTLGPMRESLHRFETTRAGVKAMLNELQSKVKERTDFLSAKGLQKWKQGCGLSYWLVWLEEFPDIYDCLTDAEQERFLSMLKAIRSAGGTIVMSLQRSDWTQMPTLARGQLAKMCFGVENATDASFGLSEAQQDANARPELWSNKQPGMAYLDAPSIADGRYGMPLRTFAWGIKDGVFDDEVASAAMRAHAAQWPASAKQVDPTTAALSRVGAISQPSDEVDGQDDDEDDEDVRNVAKEYLETEDPDPEVQAGADDEIPDIPEGDPPLRFAQNEAMTPEQRGSALMARLHELWDEGARDVGTGDFKVLWETTDISRAWFQSRMKKLSAEGIIGVYDDERQRYAMAERPELP